MAEESGRRFGAGRNTRWVNPGILANRRFFLGGGIVLLKVMAMPTRNPHRRYKLVSEYNSVNSSLALVSLTGPKRAYH